MPSSNKTRVGLSNINISFGGQSYFPYSIGLLQSYALSHIPEVVERFEFGRPLYKKIPLEQAVDHLSGSEIAFFSLSIWNAELSKAIAKTLKENNPGTIKVFGGCSVPPESRIEPFLSEYPYVDLACHGEGEKIFAGILDNYNNRDWSKVPSVSFRHNGGIISTPRASRIEALSEIPSPYLTGLFDEFLKENPAGWIGLWETNRGCPYTCSYCEWGGEVGKKVTWLEMDRIMEEIDWFSQNKVEFVRCADANFGIKPKRDIEIVKKLAENHVRYGYPQAVSVENAKNSNEATFEIQKILNDSGLSKGVNLAIQSLHEETLQAIARKNISNDLYAKLQAMFENAGISTFTDMIIGLPEESYDTFVDGVVKLMEGGQHNSMSYYNALILPNAAMGDSEYQKKYGIKTARIRQICNHEEISQETIHEVEDIVIGNNTLSTKDWRRVKAFAWESSLLYHRKLLQIPLTIAHDVYGANYRNLFEAFSEADGGKTPLLREVNNFFIEKARAIQEEGSANHIESKNWLNMWWPADQFMLINLAAGGKLDAFYKEAGKVIREVIGKDEPAIHEAILLNKHLLKLPFQTQDLELRLSHNIGEVYHGNLIREPVELQKGHFNYLIDRTSKKWNSWEDWCRKVVWWGHKKSKYLYDYKSISEVPNNTNGSDGSNGLSLSSDYALAGENV